jgi:hypothetical protein
VLYYSKGQSINSTENGLILLVNRIENYVGKSRLQSEIDSNMSKGFGAKILAESESKVTYSGSSFK